MALVDQPNIVVEHELELKADQDRQNIIGKHQLRAQEALSARRLSIRSARPRRTAISRLSASVSNSTVRPNADQQKLESVRTF